MIDQSQNESSADWKDSVSDHYDDAYFDWQKTVGEFGGWANADKFVRHIRATDTVIDFGCGGGYLLKALNCARRIGIEPNESAVETLSANGVEQFRHAGQVLEACGAAVADVIISNHALEHTLNPLQELLALKPLLKPGGTIAFVVPCDSIRYRYNPQDVNYHLFSWSPQNLGNLFTQAGFEVQSVQALVHKWPPGYRHLARLGRPAFNVACRLYGHLARSWFQVSLCARRPE